MDEQVIEINLTHAQEEKLRSLAQPERTYYAYDLADEIMEKNDLWNDTPEMIKKIKVALKDHILNNYLAPDQYT
jgi:hypothetical protein